MLQPDAHELGDVETPALVIDGAALDANIERMAGTARGRGIALRPHAKTHKSPEIARRQIAAGAIGICCATIAEAEAMVRAGIDGVLLTAPVMGDTKFSRIAKLHAERPIMAVVDHTAQVEGIARAMLPGTPPIGLLVDVDVGQLRTGVATPQAAVALAKDIASRSQFRFAGLQGYAGHAQHIVGAAERRQAAEASAAKLAACVSALAAAGLAALIVTGSGTGAYRYDLDGPYTELQVGSYVFMDAEYGGILDEQGLAPQFEPSLYVLATVVSVNQPGQFTVDAGTKSLATNGPAPRVMKGAPPGSGFRFGGDEHGIISVAAGRTAPSISARLLIEATHCDPTVNLHGSYHEVRNGRIMRWPICGRHGT